MRAAFVRSVLLVALTLLSAEGTALGQEPAGGVVAKNSPAPDAMAKSAPELAAQQPDPAVTTKQEPASDTSRVPEAPPAVAAVQAQARAAGALRIAVLDPTKVGEIPDRPYSAFVQALIAEIRKMEGVSAVGMGEIRDMLNFDRQRSLLGCGDENCLAEIGGALGVDEIVSTQLTALGDSYTVSMRRMNLRKAKVTHAENKQFEKKDGEELLAVIGPVVEALFPGKPLKEGRTRGVSKEVVARLNPPPLPRWVFFTTAGLALGAAAGGGAFGYLMNEAASDYNRLSERARTEVVAGSDLVALETKATSRANAANILFGTAGGLAIAALVEVFFTDWNNDREALQAQPAPGGISVGGSF